MSATPLTMFQGATWLLPITMTNPDGTDMDLTGATCRLMMRESYESETVVISASSAGGEIVIDDNVITITVTASTTAALAYREDTVLVYDVELVQGVTVTRILWGTILVKPEVTR